MVEMIDSYIFRSVRCDTHISLYCVAPLEQSCFWLCYFSTIILLLRSISLYHIISFAASDYIVISHSSALLDTFISSYLSSVRSVSMVT